MRHIEPHSDIPRTLCNSCIYYHAIFRTLRHLEPKTSLIACQTCKMIRHTQSPGILSKVYSSIFEYIEGYSGILMHIPPHSEACNQVGGCRPPLPCPSCTPALRHYSFCKMLILNVSQCFEYVCLDNYSVICTVTLYYTASDTFRILA